MAEIQNKRPYMEDRHVITKLSNNIDLYAVFDGHGGYEIAELCKKNIAAVLKQCISQQPYDIPLCIRQTFLLLDTLAYHNNTPQIGSTAVVMIVTPDRLWFANAGDSMAMIAFKNGKSELFSIEHKVETEQQRIIDAGGTITRWDGMARVNGTLNVSRSIGDHHQKLFVISDPFIRSIRFSREHLDIDYVILASDGIWDVFEPSELREVFDEILRHFQNEMQMPLETAIKHTLANIIELAKRKMSFDNITIMYVDLAQQTQISLRERL